MSKPETHASRRRAANQQELRDHSAAGKKLLEQFPQVQTITDATADVEIVVTPKNIKDAKPGDLANCAVEKGAEAMGYDGGLIGNGFSYLVRGPEAIRYQTPRTTFDQIRLFDLQGVAQPGAYPLKRPAPALRLARMRRRVAISAGHQKTRRTVKKHRTKATKTARKVDIRIRTFGQANACETTARKGDTPFVRSRRRPVRAA